MIPLFFRKKDSSVALMVTSLAEGGLMVKGINDGAVKAFNNRHPAQAWPGEVREAVWVC